VTGVVWVLTAGMAVWQLLDPAVLDALRRDPAALGRGEWWRVLSPLLVQSDGGAQIVGNLVFLAIIGYFAEQRFGRARWLVLYLIGGIVGEAAGYAFEPHGAGNSIAIFGLVGGLLAAAAEDRASVSPVPVVAGLAWMASLVGLDLGGYVWAAVASSLVIVFATQVAWRLPDPAKLYRAAAVLAAALAVLLVAIADDHGFPILAGLAVGTGLLVASRRRGVACSRSPRRMEEH
jgi:membrane associated rhomboid family serine protease